MAPLFTGLRLSFGRSAAAVDATPSAPGGTGGTIAIPGNGYAYHTFTTPGPSTFTVTNPALTSVEVLIAGGGGGGGNRWGGGGGAGGLIYGATMPVSATSYPISIGTGGGGATGGGTGFNDQTNGSPSSVFGYTALGGGYGGSGDNGPSNTGGSGGGATGRDPFSGSPATQPSQTPTSNIVQYGNAGGDTPGGGASTTTGGGGGGAGASGTVGGSGGNGRGGDGRQYPQFTGPLIGVPSLAPLSGYFAGGGAGGTSNAPGGLGGGGGGGTPNGTSGTTNSGGGGQSGTYNGPNGIGGSGGSGIVIVRYLA